ncbi:MAG: hypothetical protein J0G36_15605 [Afipia sp.]|jgi:hypothetical protein|nr:hypothetical protein [Afipia sp.]
MSGPTQEDRPSFLGPHEGRELDLMLAGKKHLSRFDFEDGALPTFPQKEFEQKVADGLFLKDEQIEEYLAPDGSKIVMRKVLYATISEAWRIPAMRMVDDAYQNLPGWRADLERLIGSLLGYNSKDVELFIQRLAKNNKLSYDP